MVNIDNEFKKIGVGGIVQEGIFVRFPELKPHFGDYYADNPLHHKLLLVAESNYFRPELITESVFTEPEKWYMDNNVPLIPESMVTAVSNDIWYKTFNKVFNLIGALLREIEPNYSRYSSLEDTAFYNYFLRPALKQGRIRGFNRYCQEIDRQVAGQALLGIIEQKKPDLIIFLSKFAYIEFNKYLAKQNSVSEPPFLPVIEHVSHPASIWWNRYGGVYGKQKFQDILRKHWIVTNES